MIRRHAISIWNAVMVAATLALLAAAPSNAAEPKFSELVLSEKDGKPKQVFGPATPMIFLKVQLKDVPPGAKVKAAWIAEKTKVAPPNYEIDSSEFTAGELGNRGFTISKPNAGWPVGDYRVDLSMNGKVVQTVRFKVQ